MPAFNERCLSNTLLPYSAYNPWAPAFHRPFSNSFVFLSKKITERPEMVFGPLSPGEMRVYLRLPKMNTGSSSGHRRPKTEDSTGPLFSFFSKKSNFPSSPNFSLFFLSLNKAVYTAASVTHVGQGHWWKLDHFLAWKPRFKKMGDGPTDGRTDRRTDGHTLV